MKKRGKSHDLSGSPGLLAENDLAGYYRIYAMFESEARLRLRGRDENDWPVLAPALGPACGVWTENADFFGTGIALWTQIASRFFSKNRPNQLNLRKNDSEPAFVWSHRCDGFLDNGGPLVDASPLVAPCRRGLLSDVLPFILVRFTVRWVSAKTSAWRIVVTLLMQPGIVYFLVLVPFAIPAAREEMTLEEFRQSTGFGESTKIASR